MNEQIKEVQINLFGDLPQGTRTFLLQLAQLRPVTKGKPKPPPADIVATPLATLLSVCKALNVAPMDLRSPSRKTEHAQARFIAYHIIRSNGITTGCIGLLFRRDHSTVIYGCDTHRDLIETNDLYQRKYRKVVERIKEFTVLEAVSA
jgi:hypothetical protein